MPSVQQPYSNSLLFRLRDCLFVAGELTQHQHGGDDDVGGQGKHTEDLVGGFSEASVDDLQEGLGPGRPNLQLHRQHGEEQDLDRRACRVPKRSTDSVLKIHPCMK